VSTKFNNKSQNVKDQNDSFDNNDELFYKTLSIVHEKNEKRKNNLTKSYQKEIINQQNDSRSINDLNNNEKINKNNRLKINLEEIKIGRNSFNNKAPHCKTKSSIDFGNKTMRNFNSSSRVLETQQITEMDEMEIPTGKNNFIFGKGNNQNLNKEKKDHNTACSNPMKQDITIDYEKFKNNLKNDEKYKNKKHFLAAIDVLEKAEVNKVVISKKETQQNTSNNGFWSFLNPFKCAKCD